MYYMNHLSTCHHFVYCMTGPLLSPEVQDTQVAVAAGKEVGSLRGPVGAPDQVLRRPQDLGGRSDAKLDPVGQVLEGNPRRNHRSVAHTAHHQWCSGNVHESHVPEMTLRYGRPSLSIYGRNLTHPRSIRLPNPATETVHVAEGALNGL